MNLQEIEKRVRELNKKLKLTKEEEFEYVENCKYLIKEKETEYFSAWLGSYYYKIKEFDLALKYYELADSLGIRSVNNSLGYIWYYGRTGKIDYEKAFKCFSIAASLPIGDQLDYGTIEVESKSDSIMKIADLYKNGYYVEKDYEKYKEIIEEQYNLFKDSTNLFSPKPELSLRMARILEDEGNDEEAWDLYVTARLFLAERLEYNLFFGDLNQLSWAVNDMYRLSEFDEDLMSLYDLFYLMREEMTVSFKYEETTYTIESHKEGEEMTIKFGDKWYRNLTDFFMKAKIDGKPIVSIHYDLTYWEILE